MATRGMMVRIAASIALVAILGGAAAADQPLASSPAGEWLPVPAQSLDVAQGSALDFSGLVPARAAGSGGALTLGADGHLRLGDAVDPRFNCAMIANGPAMTWALPSHAEADAMAAQLRLHGYNLVRIHFMDMRLAQHARAGQVVNPDDLDRYHYLLAALKKNGVYWMIDIITAANGPWQRDDERHSVDDLKNRVNFDSAAREKWLGWLREIYARPNPYTGVSTLADPALAFVVGANENSIAFWSRPSADGPYPAGFGRRFDQWLHGRYPDPQALAAAVPDLTPEEQAGRTPIAPPAGWNATGQRMKTFRAFVSAMEVETYHWMGDRLRDQGYLGPLLGYHEWYEGIDNRTRGALPITDVHAYTGEVSNYARGTRLYMPAMTDDKGLGAWMANAGARWLDRPFVTSEYGSPFPNPTRRDSGILFPAVAGFQDYTAMCRMAALSVEPAIPATGKAIYPYSVGLDPVGRVTETLSTLLFYRRDLASSRGPGLAVPFGAADMANANAGFIPQGVARTALLVKFGLIPPDKVGTLPQGTQLAPLQPPPESMAARAVGRLLALATGSRQQQSQAIVSALFAQGALPKGNRTSVADGVYQSQTGQILLDQPNGTVSVTTPRTEAVSTVAGRSGVTVGAMSIATLSDGGLVAATTLDGEPLRASSRILLMLVGDARNSGMAITGAPTDGRLGDWGDLPILMKRITARVTLDHDAPFTGRLSALTLNGRVMASAPVSARGPAPLALTLDTAAVRGSPTTWFLLERAAPGIAGTDTDRKMHPRS